MAVAITDFKALCGFVTPEAVWPHSGHYRPTEENFQEFMNFMKDNNVDLTDPKLSPEEDEEFSNELKSIRSELSIAREEHEEYEIQPSHSTSSVVTAATEKAPKNFEENIPQESSSSVSERKSRTGASGSGKRDNFTENKL